MQSRSYGEKRNPFLDSHFWGVPVKCDRDVTMKKSPIPHYIANRALTSPWSVEGCSRRDFKAVVVIPSLAEGDSLSATLAGLAQNPSDLLEQTLILAVINHREDAPAEQKQVNRKDLMRLQQTSRRLQPMQLAWVDAACAGRELPAAGGGVGLARKIGLDLALTRLNPSFPQTFLVSLDADTLVRPDYLPALHRHFACRREGGAVIPFVHQSAETTAAQQAIDRYELFLRHYVLGLSLAGSPYAYHTVGSALACRADAYARAGGMNRRAAGEDFYFLQQLAKISGVVQVKGTVVYPSPRPSNRTPFGTGPSVRRLLGGETAAVRFYHPDCFKLLGRWLRLVTENPTLDDDELFLQAKVISEEIAGFLHTVGFATAWNRLRHNYSRPEALLKAFHGWFDGLRTLRLIHHLSHGLRSRCEPEQSVPTLLQWGQLEVSDRLTEQLRILRRHQQGDIRDGQEEDPLPDHLNYWEKMQENSTSGLES